VRPCLRFLAQRGSASLELKNIFAHSLIIKLFLNAAPPHGQVEEALEPPPQAHPRPLASAQVHQAHVFFSRHPGAVLALAAVIGAAAASAPPYTHWFWIRLGLEATVEQTTTRTTDEANLFIRSCICIQYLLYNRLRAHSTLRALE
jgi:hypothetical protein